VGSAGRRDLAPPPNAIDWSRLANSPLSTKRSQGVTSRLRAALKTVLPDYMVPSAYVVLDQLPLTASGKIDREALPPPSNGRPQWAASYVAPRDEHEALIAAVWEELLDVRPVGASDNFFELGGHSMLAVRMTAEIERRSGQSLPLAALFQEATVEHLASLLRDPTRSLASSSLVPLQRTGNGRPLFFVHPAGGAVFCYLALAERFRNERPVYGLQAVGVDGRRPPHDNMQEMAAHYVRAIREAEPEGPYHLSGWSLGGNIAFEVARQLRQLNEQVGLLALLDSGILPPDEPLDEKDFLPLVVALFPGQDHLSLEQLREMPPAEQLQYFIQRAARAGLTPNNDPDAGRHIFQVFQANVRAVHDYRPADYPGKLTLLRPADQSKTNDLFDDLELGWGALALGGVEVLQVPGDHAHMVHEPHVAALADKLKQCLAQAETPNDGQRK
jgi:thioesterase domain-containing protein/acyl carrier protein